MMQLRRTEFMGDKLSTNVSSQQGSSECIAKLTKSIINNIYYERKLLPEEYFVTRIIEGVPVKEFIADSDNQRIFKLNEWIEDLIKSIQNKRLKNVCLELITIDSNQLVECYNIKYSYRDETNKKDIPESVTLNTIQSMLKNMKNVFQNKLSPLVDKRNLKFKLTADSSGLGCVFSSGTKRNLQFKMHDGQDIEMGAVCTPYHRLVLRVTASIKELTDGATDDVIIIEENTETNTEPEIIDISDCPDEEFEDDEESSRIYSTIHEMSNLKINCICDTLIRDQIFTMIQCKNCFTYQHAECYGIFKISKLPVKHLCNECSGLIIDNFVKDQENDSHTDPRLVEYTIGELKDIGCIRLILIYIYREKKSPVDFLVSSFNNEDCRKILEKLVNLGILIEKEDSFEMNKNKVSLFTKKHFKPKYSIDKYF